MTLAEMSAPPHSEELPGQGSGYIRIERPTNPAGRPL